MTPVVNVPSRPNGLPMAATTEPTFTVARVAERGRLQHAGVGVGLHDGGVVAGILADDVGAGDGAVRERDR